MDSGAKRKRTPGDDVTTERWTQVLRKHVEDSMLKGQVPFPIGSYATARMGQAACCLSLLALGSLLTALFKEAPQGIVSHCKLVAVLLTMVGQWPQLNQGQRNNVKWAAFMAQAIRVAMAHCRKLVQQPRKFEQRTRGLSMAPKAQLKDILELYEQPTGSLGSQSMESLVTGQ